MTGNTFYTIHNPVEMMLYDPIWMDHKYRWYAKIQSIPTWGDVIVLNTMRDVIEHRFFIKYFVDG